MNGRHRVVVLLAALLVGLLVLPATPAGAGSDDAPVRIQHTGSYQPTGGLTYQRPVLEGQIGEQRPASRYVDGRVLAFNNRHGAPRTMTYNRFSGIVRVYEPLGSEPFHRLLAEDHIATRFRSIAVIEARQGTFIAASAVEGAPGGAFPSTTMESQRLLHLYRIGDHGRVVDGYGTCECGAPAAMAAVRIGDRSFLYLTNPAWGDEVRVAELVADANPTGRTMVQRSAHELDGGPWSGMTTYHRGSSTYLFLMNSSTGQAEVRGVDPTTGAIGDRVGAPYSWTTGWTSVHAFQQGSRAVLVMVKEHNGLVHVHHPTASGRVGGKVQAFRPPSGVTNVQSYANGSEMAVLMQDYIAPVLPVPVER